MSDLLDENMAAKIAYFAEQSEFMQKKLKGAKQKKQEKQSLRCRGGSDRHRTPPHARCAVCKRQKTLRRTTQAAQLRLGHCSNRET